MLLVFHMCTLDIAAIPQQIAIRFSFAFTLLSHTHKNADKMKNNNKNAKTRFLSQFCFFNFSFYISFSVMLFFGSALVKLLCLLAHTANPTKPNAMQCFILMRWNMLVYFFVSANLLVKFPLQFILCRLSTLHYIFGWMVFFFHSPFATQQCWLKPALTVCHTIFDIDCGSRSFVFLSLGVDRFCRLLPYDEWIWHSIVLIKF